ncbi:MAG: DNA-directed RNA polymerase subunit L [Candidatus Micrarchaeota archaeon]
MELKLKKLEKNYLEIELINEDVALADSLREILLEYKDVEFAAAKMEHPQIGNPVIILRTKGKDALELLEDAVGKLKKNADEFKAALKSAKKPK